MPTQEYSLSNQAFVIVLLGLAGTLFAGYLSLSKLVLKTCALNEVCSYLLGIPTCVYGFVLFFSIFVLAWMRMNAKDSSKFATLTSAIQWISGIGILFAGYYAVEELFFPATIGTPQYSLILPSCVYGLLVFALVFWLNWKYHSTKGM